MFKEPDHSRGGPSNAGVYEVEDSRGGTSNAGVYEVEDSRGGPSNAGVYEVPGSPPIRSIDEEDDETWDAENNQYSYACVRRMDVSMK